MVVKYSANTKIPSQVNVIVTYGVTILPIASYIIYVASGYAAPSASILLESS